MNQSNHATKHHVHPFNQFTKLKLSLISTLDLCGDGNAHVCVCPSTASRFVVTPLFHVGAFVWQVILLEHEIPHESFSGKVLACLPPEDWAITPENSVGRKDLRHLPVLSIDPPGCKDIDDALHARPLENGNLEVSLSQSTACERVYYCSNNRWLPDKAAFGAPYS